MPKLDLSGLDAFKASAFLEEATGRPLELPLDVIDYDPKQPRRQVLAETLAELAETIKTDGVLQPICVRPHPDHPGRYLINHGERRVRAARLAGCTTIPAFIQKQVDPYAQVIENIQRDDLLPLELAAFVVEREQAGDSRAEIARRLGKQRSLITLLAELAQAPAPIRQLHDEGRCRDVRALYLLTRTHREQPQAVEAMLGKTETITREQVEAFAADQGVVRPPASRATRGPIRSATERGHPLVVEVDGQQATLDISKRPSKTSAQVRFPDGSVGTVELARLRLVAWRDA